MSGRTTTEPVAAAVPLLGACSSEAAVAGVPHDGADGAPQSPLAGYKPKAIATDFCPRVHAPSDARADAWLEDLRKNVP